ncbi:MAG: N-acetylmuramoyl-L-alanine amidase, partial [Actinomycetaceae bacterium]|nr:N-acetylmuramoyl-L-alanine amidase [Actinomycetaceae bacterium]
IDGSLHKGRNINIAGAHCENHNRNSIGICYIGGCANDGKLTPKDTRTPKQKETLLKLLKVLKQLYPNAKIRGHCDFANKACPSFDATREYSRI